MQLSFHGCQQRGSCKVKEPACVTCLVYHLRSWQESIATSVSGSASAADLSLAYQLRRASQPVSLAVQVLQI